jgi:hypothetical protein
MNPYTVHGTAVLEVVYFVSLTIVLVFFLDDISASEEMENSLSWDR